MRLPVARQQGRERQLGMVAAQALQHSVVVVGVEMEQLAQLLEFAQGLGPVEPHAAPHLNHGFGLDGARLMAAGGW